MMYSRARTQYPVNRMITNRSLVIIASIIFTLFIFAIGAEGSTASSYTQNSAKKAEAVPLGKDSDTVQVEDYLIGVMTSPMHIFETSKGVLSELARGYTRVASAYSDHAQYEMGIPWVNKALNLDPTLPEAHLLSGWLNQRVRNTTEAISAYERTIELDPSNYKAYLYLGIMYVGRANPSLAMDYLNQAIEVAHSPEEMSIAYTHRGHANAGLAQYEQAFADFDTALSLDPDNCLAVWIRGIVSEVVAERDNPVSDQGEDLGIEEGLAFGS